MSNSDAWRQWRWNWNMAKFIITPAENAILYINNMEQYNWLWNHKLGIFWKTHVQFTRPYNDQQDLQPHHIEGLFLTASSWCLRKRCCDWLLLMLKLNNSVDLILVSTRCQKMDGSPFNTISKARSAWELYSL